METKHTLSDLLKRLVIDVDNMNSFLMSLENILESKSENVSVTQTNSDGSTFTINVPSFGYLKGKIDDINNNFNTLLSTNDDVIGIKSENGEVRKFELKRSSQVLADLENVQNTPLTLPTEFGVKNNWFFESFLNPLLYVNLDIENILTDEIDSFSVKRIVFNSVNDDDIAAFFDTNYKDRNDISLENLIIDLNDNSIDYFEDDNIVDVAVPVNRFKGSFDVLRILEEEGTQTLTSGDTTTVIRRRYKLNTLNFTDVIAGVKNARILSEGDVLITANDSEYVVRSVNKTDTEVVLERIFGLEPITIGAATLRVKPQPFRAPELAINVGYNERQIIFIRPISRSKNLTIDDYSNGVGLYTNELTIVLPDETTTTLDLYYNNFVSDFGLILLGLAKDRKIPAILGRTPNAPTIDASNFSVVQVDQHIQNDQNIATLTNTIREKATTEKEIQELNQKIDEIKASITTSAKTQKEVKRLQKQLSETQKTRDEKTTTLSTLVTNITLQISTNPQFVTKKKYRVRGFWQIPEQIETVYGPQEVIQFKYRYRYLSLSNNQPIAQQQNFVDVDGTQKAATFSPWVEKLTKPRNKVLDTNTGLYIWDDENVSDSNVINSNQLDVPIRKGEIVEIQVKSLSEAGWPENPVESDWSNAIQVNFPENIQSEEEGIIITQRAYAEKTRIDFERSLIARGLDTHLASQFTTGERFFAHNSEDIASGFFTTEGNVIDLFEQLKTIQTNLTALQQAVAVDTGVIKVTIIDPNGNEIEVNNGDTVSLFAGYYRDLIKNTVGGTVVYKEGQVITKQYVVSIQNTSATQLELVSLLAGIELGGIDSLANIGGAQTDPIANPTDDYHVNRRYDIVPIGVNKNTAPLLGQFKQIASRQAGQVKSQYFNVRVRNFGLSEELHAPTDPATTYFTTYYDATYNTLGTSYQGQTFGGSLVPMNAGHYLPFRPNYAIVGASTNSKVWLGTYTGSTPNGNGYLTEFCIHTSHPALTGTLAPPANFSLFRPSFGAINATTTQVVLPFAHAIHFETSVEEDTNKFGVKYYKQASRVNPVAPTVDANRNDTNYPIKLGFIPNDEYLIGKYTCGAYLYAFPSNYESISVEGNFPSRSSKKVSNGTSQAINIPVLFQFRCSDILGYVGGYRLNETLTNITYQKKIGIDIIRKEEVPFSFDIEVSTKYVQETSIDAPIVQGQGKINTF